MIRISLNTNPAKDQLMIFHIVVKSAFFLVLFSYCFVSIPLLKSTDKSCCAAEGDAVSIFDDTTNWVIDEQNVFTPKGKPVNDYVTQLMARIEKSSGVGTPVSQDEFRQLLKTLSHRQIYTRQLVKYATPLSKKIQDDAHTDYSRKLMTDQRLEEGVAFLKEHAAFLKKMQQEYSVHPKDVVGILMWESALGRYTGSYRIFNVFMGQILYLDKAETLALAEIEARGDTTIKKKYTQQKRLHRIRRNAVKNLAALLRVTKVKGANPIEQLGSWGGAIGYVQFMPASLQFAVDADLDGNINLNDWPDAIFSVANYLKKCGYGKTNRSRRRAIFAYNRLDSYVNGVTQYADAVWKLHQKQRIVESPNKPLKTDEPSSDVSSK